MTDTNQKLREALQAISDIDDSTNHAVDASAALDRIGQIARQALALPTDEQVGDINVVESFTSVTKTAAPAQEPAPTWSLREALQKAKDALSLALSDVDWRKDSPTQPVIHKAYNCAHQALALPTAEQVDDINVAESFTSVTKTAAPVGELPELPLPTSIPGFYDIEARKRCVYTADQMRAYARAAIAKATGSTHDN